MFIIGSEDLLNEKIFICEDENSVLKHYENNFILIKTLALARFCFKKNIRYIAQTNNLITMMYFHNLKASHFFSEDIKFACEMQKMANEYLMDSKIALLVSSKKDILEAMQNNIDGVIFKSCIY